MQQLENIETRASDSVNESMVMQTRIEGMKAEDKVMVFSIVWRDYEVHNTLNRDLLLICDCCFSHSVETDGNKTTAE